MLRRYAGTCGRTRDKKWSKTNEGGRGAGVETVERERRRDGADGVDEEWEAERGDKESGARGYKTEKAQTTKRDRCGVGHNEDDEDDKDDHDQTWAGGRKLDE